MRGVSLRHSDVSGAKHPGRLDADGARSPRAQPELSEDQKEQLAATIVDKGSEYILQKEAARAADESGIQEADISAAAIVDPEAFANKLIKEAARELARDQGKHHHDVHEGSMAAWAERVRAKKDEPGTVEHEVFERVKEKLEVARDQEGMGKHTFVGPGMTSTSIEHGRGG